MKPKEEEEEDDGEEENDNEEDLNVKTQKLIKKLRLKPKMEESLYS